MENKNIADQIQTMIQDFKTKINNAFKETKYSNETDQIISAYKKYLIYGMKIGFLNSNNIRLFNINSVTFDPKTNSYAMMSTSQSINDLSISERFFEELKNNNRHRDNVIYHELSHIIFTTLCREKLSNLRLYILYLEQQKGWKYTFDFNSNYVKACNGFTMLFDEVLTQETSERFSEGIEGYQRKEKSKFKSKIYTPDIDCESNFQTYEDYQELFLSFARTLNGFGNLNDAEIYDKFKDMLEKGTIANHIIGTYQEKHLESELTNIFLIMEKVVEAHIAAMGINVVYTGDKEALTNEVNELLAFLRQNKNVDKFKEYTVEDYPPPPRIKATSNFSKIAKAKERLNTDMQGTKNNNRPNRNEVNGE